MTGDVKFLILDPHYPGPEDIKTITSKVNQIYKIFSIIQRNRLGNAVEIFL
jgi:hypothetical protein